MGRPGVRVRPAIGCSRRWLGRRRGGGSGWASRSWAGSAAAGSRWRSARRKRAGRRFSRCRWSRTWAARWARASVASSWACRGRRSGCVARGPSSRTTRSTGRGLAAGDGVVKAKKRVVTARPTARTPTVRRIKPAHRAGPSRAGSARPRASTSLLAAAREPRCRSRRPSMRSVAERSTCRSIWGAGWCSRTRSWWRRGRSATGWSTATSSTSSGWVRSAARARRSRRASATPRRA